MRAMETPKHPMTVRREELGLTQEALAQRVGCKRWIINRIEVRSRYPSRRLALRIEAEIGVDAGKLLGLSEVA
jgi:DNA-binding XRE family transcriptional regulator